MSKALLACYGMPRPQGQASVDAAHPDDPMQRLPADHYDAVVVASANGALSDATALAASAARARPGGSVEVREVVWVWPSADGIPPAATAPALQALRAPRVSSLRTTESLRRAIVYAGLTPVGAVSLQPLTAEQLHAAAAGMYPHLSSTPSHAPTSAETSDALAAIAELLRPHIALASVAATKPAYKQGVAFSLRSRAPVAPPSPAVPESAVLDAWSAAAGGGAGMGHLAEDSALMDEDDLLDEEDKAAKVAVRPECDPEAASQRRACKNCTCGLREELDAATDLTQAAPKSACGNCGKGDAFRCAGCPHRGKPAFEDGATVMLDASNFAPVDVGGGVQRLDSNGAPGEFVKFAAEDLIDDF